MKLILYCLVGVQLILSQVSQAQNVKPTVNAGADQYRVPPNNSITLTGSASDPEGAPLTYAWTKVSGPSATLGSTTTSTLSVSNLKRGVYIFRLTASDGSLSGSDDVVVVYDQNMRKKHTTNTSAQYQTYYWEYLPADYAASPTKKYPLIVFFHGCGELSYSQSCSAVSTAPFDSVASYNWLDIVLKAGVSREIALGSNMTFKDASGADQSFIVISPQLDGRRYTGYNGNWLDNIIRYAAKNYRVDFSRVYITGLSLGGMATYNYAQSTKAFADTVAAIAPVAGKGTVANACIISNRDIAVWAFHGDQDTDATGVSFSADRSLINALRLCVPAPDPQARFTVYQGRGHSIWNTTYHTSTPPASPVDAVTTPADPVLDTLTIYEWFLRISKPLLASNQPPQVNAGTDIVLSLPANSATVPGTATDTDGSITSYVWSKVSGPQATLTNTTQGALSVSDLVAGIYTFRLTVTDNSGSTSSDDVIVTCNQPPVVSAGADATVTLPANSIVLAGSATDTDGTIATYVWTKQSGPAAMLSGVNQATLTASGLVAGTYIFRLTATDNHGGIAFDEVIISVETPPGGGWLELTSKGVAGRSVALYYDLPNNHSNQVTVRPGNDTLQFYIKRIAGTGSLNSLRVEVTVSYQTRSLLVGSYLSTLSTDWTKVSIPLDDFAHDASKWNGGVSMVSFKVIAGFSTGVIGVDEIQFRSGTNPVVWYGDVHEVSGSEDVVVDDTTAFYVSNRFTAGGAPAAVTTSTARQYVVSPYSDVDTDENILVNGNQIDIYDIQGIKKGSYTCTENHVQLEDIPELTRQLARPGVYIFRITKPSGAVTTRKVAVRK